MLSKVQLIEDIDKVWHYATMKVQYVATILVAVWIAMSPDQQAQLLSAIGLRPDQFAIASIVMLVVSTTLARITMKKPNEPAANQ
jgi:purine-cytosine permease-like protein